MVVVRVTTEQFPFLADEIDRRAADGRDTYDEWWNKEYWFVTGPTPECGRLINKLAVLLDPLAEAVGLRTAAPLNIGANRDDCRVASLGVYHPDTPRTSPAFLESALLVVQVLLPGEVPGQRLPFYRAWTVGEYLEISLGEQTVALYFNGTDGWKPTKQGTVLPLTVTDHEIIAGRNRLDLRNV